MRKMKLFLTLFGVVLFVFSIVSLALGKDGTQFMNKDGYYEITGANVTLEWKTDGTNLEVILTAPTRGWRSKCESSAPVTRSDWILEDETGCIYVTGQFPDGVSAAEPKGERLILSGRVKPVNGGKLTIEVIDVRTVSELPKQVK